MFPAILCYRAYLELGGENIPRLDSLEDPALDVFLNISSTAAFLHLVLSRRKYMVLEQ